MPFGTNQPPRTTLVPIVNVPRGTNSSFFVPASDNEGDTLRWRLAAPGESGVTASVPPGMSINPATGQITWNNLTLNTVNFWTTQVLIEDLDALGNVKSQTPVDFLLKINPNIPPACTLGTNGPITVAPGTSVAFTITANDVDTNEVLTINTAGLPQGAAVVPPLPTSGANGLMALFLWTPTAAQAGTHPVLFSVTDALGAQSLCSITINVTTNPPPTNRPPVARCKNVTVPADANCRAAASVDDGSFDPDGDPITLVQNPPGPFSLGTHTVTLTVTDDKGASNSCTATVTVFDATPPSIACAVGTTAPAQSNCLAALPDLLTLASDNCTPSTNLVVTQTPAIGTLLGLGTNVVTITAVDASGNSNSCQTTFTVVDATPPTVNCQPPTTIPASTNCQAVVPDLLASASDDCTAATNLVILQTPPAGTVVGLGTYTVRIFAVDEAGNANPCQTTLTVVDATPPSVVCAGSMTVPAAADCRAPVPNLFVSATDNCTPGANLIITQIPAAGSFVGLGTNVITVRARDAAGNTNTCQTTLIVVDNSPPLVTCAVGMTVPAGPECQAVVPNLLASATDNCTTSSNLVVVQTPPAGTIVGLGTNVVTVTVTDAAGNSATCQTTFAVVDSTPPTVACAGAVTVSPGANCQATVPNLLASATDNCTASSALVITQSPAAGALVGLGTNVVTITATDASGNSASCQTAFIVADSTPPTIRCPANILIPCGADATTPIAFTVMAEDNCTPNPTVVCTPPSGSLFPIGTTTVVCEATDSSGNRSSCSFTVTRQPLEFDGFKPPIDGADRTGGSFFNPARSVKSGSSIPVKFKAYCDGRPVLTGSHRLQAVLHSGPVEIVRVIDVVSTDRVAVMNQFRLTGKEWHFNVNTKIGFSPGVWRLVATLSDGSQHDVWVTIKP